MPRRRLHIVFHGTVQGVDFRASAAAIARRHAVAGWVQNRADGTVEMEAEADPATLEAYLRDVQAEFKGMISQIESRNVPPASESGFSIRRCMSL